MNEETSKRISLIKPSETSSSVSNSKRTARLSPGQMLKRTMTPHNLCLFENWYSILESDGCGRVKIDDLAQRLVDLGMLLNKSEANSLISQSPTLYLDLDCFLEVLARSKFYDRRRARNRSSENKVILVPVPATRLRVRRKSSIVEFFSPEATRIRRDTDVLDLLRIDEAGGVRKHDTMKIICKPKPRPLPKLPHWFGCDEST
jgi:hypothetical protein